MKDNKSHILKLSASLLSKRELAKLKKEIVKFDGRLEHAQNRSQHDLQLWDFFGAARDALFQLNQALHGLNIIDFSRSHEDTFWVNEWLEEQEQQQQRQQRSKQKQKQEVKEEAS